MSRWFWSKSAPKGTPLSLFAILVFFGALHCTEPGQTDGVKIETASTSGTASVPRPVDQVVWPDEQLSGAPIAVEFVSIVKAGDDSLRAKVRIFNFSEVDASRMKLALECSDEEGRPVTCVKAWEASRVIPARSHATHVIGAHLSKEIADITTTVQEISFVDGTLWPEAD